MLRAKINEVVVILPASNEENHIAGAVRTIERASNHAGLPVTVVVVLDGCTDQTEAVGRGTVTQGGQQTWTWLHCDVGRASSARQSGLECADRRLVGAAQNAAAVAVLSTDADSVVPIDWISRHVAELDSGADAVAGIVDLDDSSSAQVSYTAWADEYRKEFTADGAHPHVHAANLAVRLNALLEAGGFGHARRAEDIDLWRRLRTRRSVVLRSDTSSVVRTSARLDGRVTGGFATALSTHFRVADG